MARLALALTVLFILLLCVAAIGLRAIQSRHAHTRFQRLEVVGDVSALSSNVPVIAARLPPRSAKDLEWRWTTTVAIELSGIGGLCLWQGSPSPIQRAFIAWGDVLAQGALYGVAYTLDIGMQPLSSSSLAKFLVPLFGVNVFLIVINLIPIRPLDGAEAWPIVPLLARRAGNRLRRRSRPRPPERWKH